MEESILNSVKKYLGLAEDYDVFDVDIIMAINSALATLQQLAVGPPAGFQIEGADETWAQMIGNDPRQNGVKTYVCLKTRLLFDPPATSYGRQALEEYTKEYEWRLNVLVEGTVQ